MHIKPSLADLQVILAFCVCPPFVESVCICSGMVSDMAHNSEIVKQSSIQKCMRAKYVSLKKIIVFKHARNSYKFLALCMHTYIRSNVKSIL